MWFRGTVFCCFSLLWNKSWEQKDQRTLKLVTLATVLAVSNADQRRGNIVLKRLESYYHLSKGLPNLIGQIFMGGFSKQHCPYSSLTPGQRSTPPCISHSQPKRCRFLSVSSFFHKLFAGAKMLSKYMMFSKMIKSKTNRCRCDFSPFTFLLLLALSCGLAAGWHYSHHLVPP